MAGYAAGQREQYRTAHRIAEAFVPAYHGWLRARRVYSPLFPTEARPLNSLGTRYALSCRRRRRPRSLEGYLRPWSGRLAHDGRVGYERIWDAVTQVVSNP